jgi:hypothetical protein
MNKIIAQLARAAGLAYAEDVGCGFPNIVYPPGTEKFAELIVKMCADAADAVAPSRCNAGDYVGEQLGYGQENGISEWRSNDNPS